jgi:carboxymethylenebutenolidase
MGERITFPAEGGECPGYLARPGDEGAPGVVVVQEWWGLGGEKSDITDIADRFAAAGYSALAPDLYHGQIANEPDEAGKLMMALRVEAAAKDLRGAITHLRGLTGKPVGVVGFCMGGALALFAACENPADVAACVDFYGGHPAVQYDLDALEAPVLGLFAGQDNGVSPDFVADLDRRLTERGKAHDFTTYADADHAFFNRKRPDSYHAEAADDAWRKTLAFCGEHLR